MTSLKSTPKENRIIGLFPDLLGLGGIQEAGRLTAAAVEETAIQNGSFRYFLSLNDPPGAQTCHIGERDFAFRGFGRAKIRFVLSALGHAHLFDQSDTGIVLALHPHLAVPASWMKKLAPHLKTVVMSHGVEVWEPLTARRRRALLNADLVLAPSSHTAQKLSEVQQIPEEKIRVLAWPMNPTFLRMADAPDDLLSPLTFPQGRVILTVGRWAACERYKGADELIHATAQLRPTNTDLHLVVAGDGDDIPRLQKLVVDLNIADCVHFMKNLSREEIAACYSRADVFALPSTGEGFGFVFLEAMVFAKPVVAAASGGTTDLIKDGVNGLLVPPRDTQWLVRALNCLLSDESRRRELGRRGGEIVRHKYRFEVFQAGLHQILNGFGPRREFRTPRICI
jgi:glycosyltransferase involved in cell wall biosynthesis